MHSLSLYIDLLACLSCVNFFFVFVPIYLLSSAVLFSLKVSAVNTCRRRVYPEL